MSAPNNPRRANSTRRNAARKAVAAMRRPCWICGLGIDYSLPARLPGSYEADELVPVSRGGSPFDPDNIAPAHRCCNGWRGNKSVAEVEAVRAEAARLCRWSAPEEFVAAARTVSKARRRISAAPITSTDW